MRDPRERILERVTKQDRGHGTPCWISDRAMNEAGYTKIGVRRRSYYTHRLAYEVFVGSIPESMHLDHLCRQPACCNPQHLEPVTPRENVMRGNSHVVAQAAQTHCKYGHAYAEANTGVCAGKRYCRECNRENCRRRYAAGLK